MFHLDIPNVGDMPAIENLLDICFGPDRQQKKSYHYRDGISDVADLRRVARQGDHLVGTIIYTPVLIGSNDGLLLGPVAVCPTLRGRRIGQTLIWQTLMLAQQEGHARIVLVGDETYYNQFGFQPAANFGITMTGEPDRLLALALNPGGFNSVCGPVLPAFEAPGQHQQADDQDHRQPAW